MSQNNERAARGGRKPLAPEQRRRILMLRRKRRRRRRIIAISAVGAAVAIAVALVLALNLRGGGDGESTAGLVLADDKGDAIAASAPMREIDAAPSASATPTPAPTPEPTENPNSYKPKDGVFVFDDAYAAAARGKDTGPEVQANLSSVDPQMLDRWPKAEDGYIPVLYSADTTEKIIAVTVDDCFQAGNLRQIVQCALDNSARLTVFPIGENLTKQSIADAVKWAWESGMEIENHSYTHKGTYHYDDEYMTKDIWEQSKVLNQVLGVNYKQHFFRPKGGDERKDQRTHAYASQLDMSAIAMWTLSGSSSSLSKITASLKPGAIYLFHTTDKDLEKLLYFIPYAVQQGYRLVTLNEMFGMPENETSDLSTAAKKKPALQSFKIIPREVKKTSYMRAAAVIQKRLIKLGYLKGEADGVFGESSYKATGYFQLAAGIKADGIAGVATQKKLFSKNAPKKK